MFDVITIGSITKDNFLELDCEIINWTKTPLGKAIVLPFGEKLEVKKIVCTIGGNSANASVTFSRMGFKTACFGKIGDDLAGREIKSFLKKEKVLPIFAVAKNSITAQSTLLLNKGERTILGYHGASSNLSLKDIPWNKLKSKWWYISLAGESIRFFKPMLKFAKKNGIKVAFNPSGFHIKYRKKEILDNLKYIDFLVVNEGEAASLVGISFKKEKKVFKRLDDLMPGIVAVTNGPKGVTVSDGKHIFKAGIFREKIMADRTGAGDAFGSGFTAGLMQKKDFDVEDIKNAIRLASANATSVVEHIGTTPGIIKKGDFNKSRFKNLKIKIYPVK
ncbi:carbohydrate kinase family protein [Patescibacteria group bacterium]|nr:carbohydrate kinase family protein [Patescibacteria group bacterium]